MKVQHIDNYEQRMLDYRIDVREFWLKELPVIALICGVVIFSLMYGTTKIPGYTPPFGQDWRFVALLFYLGVLIAPIKMMFPEKPDPVDVLRDQALRRSAGMDDTVSPTGL